MTTEETSHTNTKQQDQRQDILVNSSKDSSEVESFGSYLQQMRKEQAVTLEEISQKTFINLSLLKSLEREEYHKLPNKTYIRGFIKKYAKILQMPEEEFLKKFDSSYKANISDFTQPKAALQGSMNSKDLLINKKKVSIPFFKIILPLFFLIGIALIAYRYSLQIKNSGRELLEFAKAKEDSTTVGRPLNKNHQAIEKISSMSNKEVQTNSLLMKEEPILLSRDTININAKNKSSSLNENSSLQADNKKQNQDDPHKDIIKFTPIMGPLYSLSADSNEFKHDQLIPESFHNFTAKSKHNVILHAKDGDSWITFKNW